MESKTERPVNDSWKYLIFKWATKKKIGELQDYFQISKTRAVSGQCYWGLLYFTNEHTFGPLEENKQAHNMNMLYKGTESVGKSQCHNSAFGGLNCLIRSQSAEPGTSFHLCWPLNIGIIVWAAELCQDNNSLLLFAGGKVLEYLSLALEVPKRVSVAFKENMHHLQWDSESLCSAWNGFMGSKNLMHLTA